jgi:hypothetical protein
MIVVDVRCMADRCDEDERRTQYWYREKEAPHLRVMTPQVGEAGHDRGIDGARGRGRHRGR